MKITSFNPLIATKDAEPIISLFEALGFEKRHAPSNTAASGNDFTDYRMGDANGFRVDVVNTAAKLERDITSIRINVDDFDEVYKLLIDHGFKPQGGNPVTESVSAKGLSMVSPSGFSISLVKHIKKEDRK